MAARDTQACHRLQIAAIGNRRTVLADTILGIAGGGPLRSPLARKVPVCASWLGGRLLESGSLTLLGLLRAKGP
jgi:hypothetical protein